MNKKTKKILIASGIGVLVLTGLGIYLYRRNQAKKQEADALNGSTRTQEDLTDTFEEPTSYGFTSKVSYIEPKPGGTFALHLQNRPPAGTINTGDKVTISGSPHFNGAEKNVVQTWIDKNGNIGALYIRPNNSTKYNALKALFTAQPKALSGKVTISTL